MRFGFGSSDGPDIAAASHRNESVPNRRIRRTAPLRNPTMKLDGGQALIKSLEMEGVETIFGLPGGAILPVYDPIIDSPIRHILVRHEQGAGHMAEGYAHATGRPGVAMVTSGPGATNIVTPLCDAYMDSVPMVVITGQVPTSALGTDAFQECGHHRHHHGDHQAQLPRDLGPGHPPGDPRGVPHRHDRPTGPGAGRHPQGHRRPAEPQLGHGVVLAASRCDLPGYHPVTKGDPGHDPQGGRADPGVGAAGHLRRRRHPQGTGRRGAARSWPSCATSTSSRP